MKSYKKLIVTLIMIILVIVGLFYFGRKELQTNDLTNLNTNLLQIQAKVKGMTNKEQAKYVGGEIARLAKKKKIEEVVFDRGGYLYTGRVKELADGARAAGLKF